MSLFQTKEDAWKDFSNFLNNLRILGSFDFDPPFWAERSSWEFTNVVRAFEGTNYSIRQIRDLFFRSSKKIDLNLIEPIGLGGDYVRRCLGHRVNLRSFFRNPRMCVLVSSCVIGDRWREAEEFIGSDSLASYLYSKYVLNGILPSEMHSRMVLRSFEGVDFASRRYFEALYNGEKETTMGFK